MVAAASLYAATAARDIVTGDTAEFVMVGLIGGVAHAPGYPLLALIGHAFALLPLDPPAFRENLVSVVCHALTVGAVYATALRLTRHVGASAVAGLALAFDPLFWQWSLVAETFPLNDLLAAVVVYLAIRWYEDPRRWGLAVAVAFTLGLGLADHQTIVFVLPGLAFLAWARRASLPLRTRSWLVTAGAVALGMTPYLTIFVASAQRPYWNWEAVSSVGDLVGLFLRRAYGTGHLLVQDTFNDPNPVGRVLALFGSYPVLGGVLMLAGLVGAYRRARWYFWATLASFAVAGPAFVAYTNADWSQPIVRTFLPRFFLLPHVITAPLAGFGLLLIVEFVAARTSTWSRWSARGVTALAVAASLATIPLDFARLDRRDDQVLRRFGQDILATLQPRSVFIVGGDPEVLSTAYLQAVEGMRPDVAILVSPLLQQDWYLRDLHSRRPDLVLPFIAHRGRTLTFRSIVEADPARPVEVLAPLDDSLVEPYWFFRRGLVLSVERRTRIVTMATLEQENERLQATYRPPRPSEVRDEYERSMLNEYAFAAYDIGRQFEILGDPASARTWYERALAIYPSQPEANAALAKFGR